MLYVRAGPVRGGPIRCNPHHPLLTKGHQRELVYFVGRNLDSLKFQA